MADPSFYTNEQLLELLTTDEQDKRVNYSEQIGGPEKRGPLLDFLGAGLWGAAESASFGGLTASDLYQEYKKGDAASTWEEALSFGTVDLDNWDDMSNMAKAGYSFGSVIGMLPSFGVGGAAAKVGVTGLGKLGGKGAALAARQSTQELVDAGAKIAVKEGVSASKSLTDDAAKKVIDEAFEFQRTSNDIFKLDKEISSDVFKTVMQRDVRSNIGRTLNIADDEMAEALAKETVEIVTRNNPADAMSLIRMTAGQLPGVGERGSQILGAMGFDAAIGLVIGTMRSAADQVWKINYGVERDHHTRMLGYSEDGPNYNFNLGDASKAWALESLKESLIFSVIGPVKFFGNIGGKAYTPQGSHSKRLASYIGNTTKAYWKPLNRYTGTELKAQITAMDEISGGFLNSKISSKFSKMGKRWWMDIAKDDDAGQKLMQEYLGAIRRKYVTRAPVEWFKEFTTDWTLSLPRMTLGVVAMNLPNLYTSLRDYGFSHDAMKNAFGHSIHERITNIGTAMFFTKRPHAFHTEATPTMFSKLFNTGQLDGYIKSKSSKLREMIGGLHTFGADVPQLQRVITAYGAPIGKGAQGERSTGIQHLKKVLDSTPEFNEISRILEPYRNAGEVLGGTDLKTAFNKRIRDMVEKGEITPEESISIQDNLYIAERILELHNNNTGSPFNLDTVTPVQAYDIVSKLSTMSFRGKKLSTANFDPEYKQFLADAVSDATYIPQEVLKGFIREVYQALDIDVEGMESKNGVLTLPKILDVIDFGDLHLQNTFATVFKGGVQNNWIIPGEAMGPAQAKIGADAQAKMQEAFLRNSKKMMNVVWGENWEGTGRVLDDLILQNDSWRIPFHDMLLHKQREDAYKLFNFEEVAAYDNANALQFHKSINNFFKFKNSPEILKLDKTGKSADQDPSYGEAKHAVETVHRIIKMLNPTISDDSKKTMTLTQAKEFKDLISGDDGRGGLFGDLLTNPEALSNFELYIRDKSMDKLGVHDLRTGVDTRAALHQLIMDPTFNYQDQGTTPIMPSIKNIKAILAADKTLDAEYKKKLETFYTDLTNSLNESKFNIRMEDTGLVQRDNGDWIKALTKSYALGQQVMDSFSADRVELLKTFIGNEEARIQRILEGLRTGELNVSDAKRKKFAKLTQQYLKDLQVTSNLKDMIKTALQDRNVYKIRALAKEEASVNSALQALSKLPIDSDRAQYMKVMLDAAKKAELDEQQSAWSESRVTDEIKDQMSRLDMPKKDVQDKIMRITQSQFASKYRVSISELDKIFSIDRSINQSVADIKIFVRNIIGDTYDNPHQAPVKFASEINQIKKSLEGLTEKTISFDSFTSDGSKNFENFVIKSLRTRMEMSVAEGKVKVSDSIFDSDVHNIVSNYFSKAQIKTLKIDLRDNKLIQGSKAIGRTANRGFMGILEALDPSQNNIFLADISGTDVNGNVIRNVVGKDLNHINKALGNGEFTIRNPLIYKDIVKFNDPNQVYNTNMQPGGVSGQRFKIIPMNEKTAIIVRVDNYQGTSIHKEIQAQFRGSNDISKDAGGDLFRKLEAIYDGDLTLKTPQHQAIRDILKRVRSTATDNDIVEAIKLTRMILNMPAYLHEVIDAQGIQLDHARVRDIFKRDNLTETKNGFVASPENLMKTALLYKNAKSKLHKEVYDNIKDWIEPKNGEYRKLKIASINDEGVIEVGGRSINIFNSLDRARVQWGKDLANNRIGQKEHDANIAMYEAATKSIVDGEFFLADNPYLASMAMMGIHEDMIRTNPNNGSIFDGKITNNNPKGNLLGFKSGGIKPTIAHSDVVFDKANANYGKVDQFFAKTAFKHNPLLNGLMGQLGIDGLTFKSANKFNTIKKGPQQKYMERYIDVKAVSSADTKSLEMDWHDFISQKGNLDNVQIVEIPFESMSLRTVSREHEVTVSQNLGVHMNHDNGISGWIGLNQKLSDYQAHLTGLYTNPMERTALAKTILSDRANSGDPSMINSAISSIISRTGMIIEPWAQRRLEDNMIGYFLNNGSIGGGTVKGDGSIDIMSADMGNLKVSTRSEYNGTPTVRYFGEFLPSYYASQQKFHLPGTRTNGVHSVIIHEVSYANNRKADAFMTYYRQGKFLQVEGRLIDKGGNLRDVDTGKVISTDPAEIALNKKAFEQVLAKDKEIHDKFGYTTTIADASYIIQNNYKGQNISVGSLNSRQPRNMMGDIVINRIGFVDGKPHADQSSGNVSRMNHLDAIKPQDADFDFDKSFNYNAAPGLFWKEVSKNAGRINEVYEGKTSTKEVLDDYFNPIAKESQFAQTMPQLVKAGASNDVIMREVEMARGQFVKMHQIVTYLANITRENPHILTFETDLFIQGAGKKLQVRLADQGRYANTVKNISKLATDFIDVYKDLIYLPSEAPQKVITKLQNQVLFGPNGIFEIGYTDMYKPDKFTAVKGYNLQQSGLNYVRDAINTRWISPLKKYLTYNKGVETESTGIENKATLQNYSRAFEDLVSRTLDPTNNWGIDKRVNFESGLISAGRYFNETQAPFDLAMRELHNTYNKLTTRKQAGQVGKGRIESQDIIDYLEGGFGAVKGVSGTDADKYNHVFQKALKEYVSDESSMLNLIDLKKRQHSIEIEIENEMKYHKGTDKPKKVRDLELKKAYHDELIESLEEALSYRFRAKLDVAPETIFNNRNRKSGELKNVWGKHVVIVNASGKIKEVVLADRWNKLPISKSDKIIKNGRHFKLTDGTQQEGLRILAEAYSDLPRIAVGRGENMKWVNLETAELQNFILSRYKDTQRRFIELNEDMRSQNILDNTEKSIRRESLLNEILFTDIKNDVERKAFILRLIAPDVSDKVVSVRSVNRGGHQKAVYDYMYSENMYSEKVMSLLSKIESGEFKGDSQFAKEVLDDINIMKNIGYIKSKNPNIDFELLQSRMYTEPASIDGFMTKSRYLDQRIFEKRLSQDSIERGAAKIMIDYAGGKGLVDPVILYKASKIMESNGIPIHLQWGRIKYVEQADGGIRNFGAKRMFISEADALTRSKLGERGGHQKSVVEQVRDKIDCLK